MRFPLPCAQSSEQTRSPRRSRRRLLEELNARSGGGNLADHERRDNLEDSHDDEPDANDPGERDDRCRRREDDHSADDDDDSGEDVPAATCLTLALNAEEQDRETAEQERDADKDCENPARQNDVIVPETAEGDESQDEREGTGDDEQCAHATRDL